MKHLKYNEEFNFFRKKKKPVVDVDNLDIPDFINNVYDIFLELKDEGFLIKTPYEKQRSIDELKKIRQQKTGPFLNVGIDLGVNFPSFRLSDVSETILRLFDYSESKNVKMNITLINSDGTSSYRDKEGFNDLNLSKWVRFVKVEFY